MYNKIVKIMQSYVQHYNHEKYWKMREEVINPKSKKCKLIRLYYLYKIKKSDAFNNASFGTNMGSGAKFDSPPILYHHLNGIIISYHAKIGKNCTIYQQVTISDDSHNPNLSAIIGDNVIIGAGAKIIGHVKIGNNVKIGANAVVTHDITDNSTVVGVPARIIKK